VPPEASPTARALRTLEVLQARPGVTAGELADRLGVTERAVRRYIAILKEAGIPVEATRGRYGGYRLGRGVKLPPVAFSEAEGLALVMAVVEAGPLNGADNVVGAALEKVVRALPDAIGRQAAALWEHAAAAPEPSAPRPDPVTTSTLVGAVAARRRTLISYRSEHDRAWEVEVDPWAVVVRHGRWYLLCYSHHAGAVRTYRIDRVLAVAPTSRRFDPPEGLDPVATLEEHLGLGWEFPTRVHFDAPFDELVRWIRPPMGRLEPSSDGCTLVGSTRNPTMYAQEWLARLPFGFRVEGGPELRDAMEQLAWRLAKSVQA
jgi:predicted DNA-binding transcriptional regulator YafY